MSFVSLNTIVDFQLPGFIVRTHGQLICTTIRYLFCYDLYAVFRMLLKLNTQALCESNIKH